ncbi:hypothetical protein BDN72DRAFT_844926 [Pluteus cervinus]|uniref:Uncharacterized protein n=1 Tax=Pluteus cervinus TaxID=181527 RepID=A0ACD3AL20_9AGAR|nr:hypothetical protein BDN72DRAFT_844926 [Pluteus cervinus]
MSGTDKARTDVKLRAAFYSFALCFALFETILAAIVAALYVFKQTLHSNLIASVIGVPTLVWISVLLAYNNRLSSTHFLARATTHFNSFVVMSLIWLGVSIFLSSLVPLSCRKLEAVDTNGLRGISCTGPVVTAIFAWLTFITLSLCAALARKVVTNSKSRTSNITECDVF